MFWSIVRDDGVRTSDVSPKSNEPARVALAVADTFPASDSRRIRRQRTSRSGPAIHSTGAEPPRNCTQQRIHYRAAKEAGQTIEAASPELVAGNHLLAKLVFHQIRPRIRSTVMRGPNCPPEQPQRLRTPIAPPDIASPVIDCAARLQLQLSPQPECIREVQFCAELHPRARFISGDRNCGLGFASMLLGMGSSGSTFNEQPLSIFRFYNAALNRQPWPSLT
jgi:hypothetical protein